MRETSTLPVSGNNSGSDNERDKSSAPICGGTRSVSSHDGGDGSSSSQKESYAGFVTENEFAFRDGSSQEYLFHVEAGDVCQIVLPLKPEHSTLVAKSYVVAARCLTAAEELTEAQIRGWPVSQHLHSTFRYVPAVEADVLVRIPQFVIPGQVALLGLRVVAWPLGCGLPAPCSAPPYLVMCPSDAPPEPAEFGLVRFHAQAR